MKFTLEPNQITIRLEGLEQIWALKRRVQIPHYAILDVNYEPNTPTLQDFRGHIREPGMNVPMQFVAGTYRGEGQKEFWYVHMHQPGVLTIHIKPETLRYDKVRVTCNPQLAQNIADWWQERK
jgi:hypothetical protein